MSDDLPLAGAPQAGVPHRYSTGVKASDRPKTAASTPAVEPAGWLGTRERRRMLKFVLVGTSNTVVMYGVYVALLAVGIPYAVALACDYVLGVLYGFVLNRRWTFRTKDRPLTRFVRYCTGYVGVFALNLALLIFFVETLAWSEALAQIPAIGIATLASYAVQRAWVFRSA